MDSQLKSRSYESTIELGEELNYGKTCIFIFIRKNLLMIQKMSQIRSMIKIDQLTSQVKNKLNERNSKRSDWKRGKSK
jgi:hypothetical protein